MKEITILQNDAGQRLDKFLSKAYPNLPPSLLYKAVRTKKIKVNRARTQPGYMLSAGDCIQMFLPPDLFEKQERDESSLARIRPNLDIVYEDKDILILNKRPGVLVHEDEANNDNTLIRHVQAYLYQKGEYNPQTEQSFAPALCNRIDRNTGGLVLAAKNAEALRCMNEWIRKDELEKFYICAVHGIPQKKSQTLHAFIRKDEKENLVRVYDSPVPGSKEIATRYELLAQTGDQALLLIELLTGRTHQIRAHMAHIGHPLLGDGKYGINRNERKDGFKHQALYAFCLRFSKEHENRYLADLEGKSFRIPLSEIWFLGDFPSFSAKTLDRVLNRTDK
ncbi:MAG: RluA family pseudouridine synthase [Clostridia bacterium]|nr:RluA family pseudouridine synthase [Clostridia bacterium]